MADPMDIIEANSGDDDPQMQDDNDIPCVSPVEDPSSGDEGKESELKGDDGTSVNLEQLGATSLGNVPEQTTPVRKVLNCDAGTSLNLEQLGTTSLGDVPEQTTPVRKVLNGGAGTSLNLEQLGTTSLGDVPEKYEQTTPVTKVTRKKEIEDCVYHLKWILWHERKTPIVTQNENGPCPLIAISNILLLRGKIILPTVMEVITAKQLMEYIGDMILQNVPKNLSGLRQLNYEQNMHDAIAVLPRLHTGLDVNVKFTGVQDFEYTPECIVFDLLNIPLYHGWLVDPQCHETVSALGTLGYNQIVEKIILNKCSNEVDLVTEALIAEQFLERTASQLTYHGLCELNVAMRSDELAVLFRNNHFSTIFKKGQVCGAGDEASSDVAMSQDSNELFQLVTDQGFLQEPRVVWETLSNIEGDGMFVDGRFVTVPPKTSGPYRALAVDVTEDQQINHDEELARRLHEDERRRAQSPVPVANMSHGHSRSYSHAQPASGVRNKKGSCDIL